MKKQITIQTFETRYIKPDKDDWYDIIMGTITWTLIFGLGGVLLMHKLEIPRIFQLLYIIVILGLVVYRYWKDGQLEVIETGLKKDDSLDLIRNTLNQLDWSFHESKNEIYIGDNKYVLKFIRSRIIYTDGFLGYNFQYDSSKSGRPAFLFGIRTYLKSKFESKLNALLKERLS